MIHVVDLKGQNDIFENLSLEENLLYNHSDNFLLIYESNPCVVLGKFQNMFKEIDVEYCLKNNVQISRRISGGGAVYHDHGNINFSFIVNNKDFGKLIPNEIENSSFSDQQLEVKFKQFALLLVQDSLKNFNINTNQTDFFDLYAKFENRAFKITGSASRKIKNRYLFHFTLLVSSATQIFKNIFKPSDCYSGLCEVKGINSRPAKVINTNQINKNLSVDLFKNHFLRQFENQNNSMLELALENSDNVINKLKSFEHIIGSCSIFKFEGNSNEKRFEFTVDKGYLTDNSSVNVDTIFPMKLVQSNYNLFNNFLNQNKIEVNFNFQQLFFFS